MNLLLLTALASQATEPAARARAERPGAGKAILLCLPNRAFDLFDI